MTLWATRSTSGRAYVKAFGNNDSGGGTRDGGGPARASKNPQVGTGRRRPWISTTSARTAGVVGGNGGIGVGSRLKPPPSPSKDIPSSTDIDALEQALVFNIRTAGLKPGRENQLADEASRLRRRRKGWLDDAQSVLREWAAHARSLWELHEQELSRLQEVRRERDKRHSRSLADLTKQLSEERERASISAAQEKDAEEAQLRAAQEAHELWKHEHEEVVQAEAQAEISRAATRLRRDAEQHIKSLKATLETEYADRLASETRRSDESNAKANVADKKVARLESVARRLEAQLAEAAERTRRIERLSKSQKEVVEDMKDDLEKRARRLARRLKEEEDAKEDERSKHEAEILAVRNQWKDELRAVDERVRRVIGSKDEIIEGLAEECQAAARRSETAEALLEELHVGICPSGPAMRHSRQRGDDNTDRGRREIRFDDRGSLPRFRRPLTG